MKSKQYIAAGGAIFGALVTFLTTRSILGHMMSGVSGSQAVAYAGSLLAGMLIGTCSYVAFRYYQRKSEADRSNLALEQSVKTLAGTAKSQPEQPKEDKK